MEERQREWGRRATDASHAPSVAFSTTSRVSVPNTITKEGKVPRHFMQIGNVDTRKSLSYKAIQELQVGPLITAMFAKCGLKGGLQSTALQLNTVTLFTRMMLHACCTCMPVRG